MPWAKLDVGWYRDPKITALSWQAELLYVRAIAFAVDELSDGVIVFDALPLLAGKLLDVDSAAAELVARKLWVSHRNGFRFPRKVWQKWQVSRSDVEARRAKDAARQRKHRAGGHAVTDALSRRDSSVSHAHVTAPDTEPERDTKPSLSNPPDPLSMRAERNGERDNPRRMSDTFRAITNREAEQ